MRKAPRGFCSAGRSKRPLGKTGMARCGFSYKAPICIETCQRLSTTSRPSLDHKDITGVEPIDTAPNNTLLVCVIHSCDPDIPLLTGTSRTG